MRDTSIETYKSIQEEGKLGPQQRDLYYFIVSNPDLTDAELTHKMGCNDPNTIRPRRKELYDMDLVCEGIKRNCRVTGRVAYTWRIGKPDRTQRCASEQKMNNVYKTIQEMNDFQKHKVAEWLGYA